ncbi:MAG TPA: hypothetical protein DDW87_07785 [Firmicutes bacterium]|nr:hypothetical protein [Bacillota bacterium]
MSLLSKLTEYYQVAGTVKEIEIGNPSRRHSHVYFYFVDMIKTRLRFRLGAAEYLKLGIYRLSPDQRNQIVTRHDRDRIVRHYNDVSQMHRLNNKLTFLTDYASFTGRSFLAINDVTFEEFEKFMLTHKSIIAKHSDGGQGEGIKTYSLSDGQSNIEDIYHDIRVRNHDVVEELLVQHPSFAPINKYGFPVVRVLTFLDEKSMVHILATTLTVAVNDVVVNLHRGGIYLNIDGESGKVSSLGIDEQDNIYEYHPLTKEKFVGFQIPLWEALLELVQAASKITPEVRYVGWDVGVSPTGPVLIEANVINPGIVAIQHPVITGGSLIGEKFRGILAGLP